MIIKDTTGDMFASYDADQFRLEKWSAYVDAAVPGARELCLADLRKCIAAGYSWEKVFLPVLNAAARNTALRTRAVASFHAVTARLEERVAERFGKTVDAAVILYLGLCNGAGWVTVIKGMTTVLLGIEKIIELDWCGLDDMTGLIVHELGHVYQSQHGVLRRDLPVLPDQFLWQLFTEGVAMVFEQEIMGDPAYYHQDKRGWKRWCDLNASRIRESFWRDRLHMTQENQRYFGDWVSFEGHGDTGYYLGARFVRFLMNADCFDHIISYDMETVKAGFDSFMRSDLS